MAEKTRRRVLYRRIKDRSLWVFESEEGTGDNVKILMYMYTEEHGIFENRRIAGSCRRRRSASRTINQRVRILYFVNLRERGRV
jgi:hypothetical protein